MHRALWEFRIRGVVTNLRFLDQLIMHPQFASADYTTQFIDETPELFRIPRKRDRATRLLSFIGDVIVNGNPEVNGRDAQPRHAGVSAAAARARCRAPAAGHASRSSTSSGPERFAALDAAREARAAHRHQHARCAPVAARDALAHARHGGRSRRITRALLPQLFSVECWGGATFDVAHALPARRTPGRGSRHFARRCRTCCCRCCCARRTRSATPTIPTTWCATSSTRRPTAGIDVFRVFDCLNWVDEHAGRRSRRCGAAGRLCEAAICYTGNLAESARDQVRPRVLPRARPRN